MPNLVIILCLLATFVVASEFCRYAPLFSREEIIGNETSRSQFLHVHATMERGFYNGIGLNQVLKTTYDGQRLDLTTGMPNKKPHMFSAPSKESLHVALLVRFLFDASQTRNFTATNMTSKQKRSRLLFHFDEAIDLVRRKVHAFEAFNQDFPGYGGFFPWVQYSTNLTHMSPAWNWQNSAPALDNGELFWGAFALSYTLNQTFYRNYADLAQRWSLFYRRMVAHAKTIFYDGHGRVRAVVQMTDQRKPVSENNYTTVGGGFLDDPYEGEMFTDMLYLLSDDLSQEDKEQLWVEKRRMLQAVNLSVWHENKIRNITVQRGFWFSAHEQWKYNFLPYYLSEINWRVFRNGERARTWYAAASQPNASRSPIDPGLERPSPGMWASVNGPVNSNTEDFPYFSACGIQPIAFENVTADGVITPYSVFPTLLVNESVGAAWLHHILLSRKAQNCFGTTESLNVSGTNIAPLTTWDSKIPTLVSSLGGVADVVERGLGPSLLNAFRNVVDREWHRVFGAGPLTGEELPFRFPDSRATIPKLLSDFTTCNETTDLC